MAFKTETANESLIEANAENSKLVDSIGVTVAAIKVLEKEVEDKKNELRNLAKAAYWDHNFQADEPQHTFDANGRTYVAQINFENAYHLNKERFQQLTAILGEDLMEHIQEQPVVNINVNDLDKDERVEFYRAIKEVCDEHGVQGFVDEKYVVAEAFHNERHEWLPRVNQAVDNVLPLKVSITI